MDYHIVAHAARAQVPTQTQKTRESRQQHPRIRLPSCLWILLFMLLTTLLPTSCCGACVNTHSTLASPMPVINPFVAPLPFLNSPVPLSPPPNTSVLAAIRSGAQTRRDRMSRPFPQRRLLRQSAWIHRRVGLQGVLARHLRRLLRS